MQIAIDIKQYFITPKYHTCVKYFPSCFRTFIERSRINRRNSHVESAYGEWLKNRRAHYWLVYLLHIQDVQSLKKIKPGLKINKCKPYTMEMIARVLFFFTGIALKFPINYAMSKIYWSTNSKYFLRTTWVYIILE